MFVSGRRVNLDGVVPAAFDRPDHYGSAPAACTFDPAFRIHVSGHLCGTVHAVPRIYRPLIAFQFISLSPNMLSRHVGQNESAPAGQPTLPVSEAVRASRSSHSFLPYGDSLLCFLCRPEKPACLHAGSSASLKTYLVQSAVFRKYLDRPDPVSALNDKCLFTVFKFCFTSCCHIFFLSVLIVSGLPSP